MSYTNSNIRSFSRSVLSYYKKHGRHTLPWRQTRDPYRILVSEIMLQQTQVERVIVKYKSFLKRFPTLQVLAQAPLSAVLKEWQGLGYNRRAKMLHGTAKAIVTEHKGKFPQTAPELLDLPGVGPYTASAVRVFAFNEPDTLIETNIRSVFIHHFFPKSRKVVDVKLLPLIAKTVSQSNPREWYSALMDYGSHLKSITPNPSRKSAHHMRQKPFKGSDREIRGTIIKTLADSAKGIEVLLALPFTQSRIKKQLEALTREGLIKKSKSAYALSD